MARLLGIPRDPSGRGSQEARRPPGPWGGGGRAHLRRSGRGAQGHVPGAGGAVQADASRGGWAQAPPAGSVPGGGRRAHPAVLAAGRRGVRGPRSRSWRRGGSTGRRPAHHRGGHPAAHGGPGRVGDLVGLAAGIGAGISMGFAEALSDDGRLTGRGRPWVRGVICGLMATVGGLGHTFPYLIPHLQTATASWTPRSPRPSPRLWWAACWCS